MNKTKHLFLIITSAILLLNASIQAQEDLPSIIKNIEPSVTVVLTYDCEGKILAQGTGFFINPQGDIVTNWHVLSDSCSAEIKTSKGKIYPISKVLAEDKDNDLILLSIKITQSEVRPLSVTSTIPQVGERIIVIGSPLGFEQTVSDGIVSAVRDIQGFGKIIQISAPISPGSSGSPVINMKGEVIGIASFQIVEGQNLNFAIPGERVLSLKPGKGKDIAEIQGSYISSEEANKYVGDVKTVCGIVASARYAKKSKGQPTFLNLNKPYPNQIFTVVIWGEDRVKFKIEPEKYFNGKRVCVTGEIIIYRGIPEIIVKDPAQIHIAK